MFEKSKFRSLLALSAISAVSVNGVINRAEAACSAAPVGSSSDTVIRMRAAAGSGVIGPTSALSATGEGAVVYDSTNKTLSVCDGTAWVTMGSGGGSTPPTCNGTDKALNWDGSSWVCRTVSASGHGHAGYATSGHGHADLHNHSS